MFYELAFEFNDVDAKYRLGEIYLNGYGYNQNYSKAFEIYSELAKRDDKLGIANLNTGLMYKDGNGVKQDLEKAYSYIKKSAEKNNAEAQFWIGYMYFHGEGVEQSDKSSIEWLNKSVEQQNDMAQWLLGILYFEGNENGVEIEHNAELGIKLLKMSAEQGNKNSIEKLKEIYE